MAVCSKASNGTHYTCSSRREGGEKQSGGEKQRANHVGRRFVCVAGFPRQGTTSPHHHLHQDLWLCFRVTTAPRNQCSNPSSNQSINQSISTQSIRFTPPSHRIASHRITASLTHCFLAQSQRRNRSRFRWLLQLCLADGPCPAQPWHALTARCHSGLRCGPSPLAAVADLQTALRCALAALGLYHLHLTMRIRASSKQRGQ
ncbi:hypothetical protein IWX49DRAFT_76022 [Phyllosticta citricarpa]|uniref:Uncharacterized protein n=2 Tax=Phyllosticta TaxID=121621 RepID=A0ABR1LUZ1_9PEZI